MTNPVVAPVSEMDDSTFIKHWNARHSAQGHLEERSTWADEVATFRAYHRRIHDGIAPAEVNHDHRPEKGTE